MMLSATQNQEADFFTVCESKASIYWMQISLGDF